MRASTPRSLASLAAVLSLTACVSGPESSPVQTAAGTATTAAPGDQVCRRETPAGSTIAKRVCRSRADIEREAELARRVAGRMGDGTNTASGPE
jgi:hypothetical protein